jgi:type IV secretory pathway VirJ component
LIRPARAPERPFRPDIRPFDSGLPGLRGRAIPFFQAGRNEMRRFVFITVAFGLTVPLISFSQETVEFGAFGKIVLYRNSPRPKHVALFASGDGGWNLGVIGMAKALESMDAVVAGIDVVRYLKTLERSASPCGYPASDFEELGKFVQRHCGFPEYVTPVLVGYSSGATLVYAVLAQAPASAFRGALSLGFCPDLPLSRPLCRGNGFESRPGPGGKGVVFLPCRTLEPPWIALQGKNDQVCDADSTARFIGETKNASLVLLPKVGHGYAVEKNWMPQFKDAFRRLAASASVVPPAPALESVGDLPLIEVAASGPPGRLMAVHITGDGGWGVTDRGLANALAEHGVPVVALNALQYFWKRRTPEESSKDLSRILSTFLSDWKKEKAVLIGYSLGADVLPFMVTRLSDDLRSRIHSIVLLGPSAGADFEFHLADWFGPANRPTALPVIPEIEKLKGEKILCLYGEEDREAVCRRLDPSLAKVIVLKGGHRIGGDYSRLIEPILSDLR